MGWGAASIFAAMAIGSGPVEVPTAAPSLVPVAPELITAGLLAERQDAIVHVWRPRRPGQVVSLSEPEIALQLVPVSFTAVEEEFPQLISEDQRVVAAPAPVLKDYQGVRRYPRQQDQ